MSTRGMDENSLAWWAVIWGSVMAPFSIACALVTVVQLRSVPMMFASAAASRSAAKVLDNWTGAVMFIAMFCAVMLVAKQTRSMKAGIAAGLACTLVYTIANIIIVASITREYPTFWEGLPTSPIVLAVFVAVRTAILPTALGSLIGEKWGDLRGGRATYAATQVQIGDSLREDTSAYADILGVPRAPVEEAADSQEAQGAVPGVDWGAPVAPSAQGSFGAPVAPAAVVAATSPVIAVASTAIPSAGAGARPASVATNLSAPPASGQSQRVAYRCASCGASNSPMNAKCIVCGKPIPARA
ncbi:MAG: hypothetical protein HY876_05265 [Coriobacteriales bacterium]|nr:hypothetical protein [Coriobacteriales bacterium]